MLMVESIISLDKAWVVHTDDFAEAPCRGESSKATEARGAELEPQACELGEFQTLWRRETLLGRLAKPSNICKHHDEQKHDMDLYKL